MASVDTTASPAVAPPPALADVPFIDALSESAANESDGSDPAGTGAAPPPPDAERCESRDSPDRDQGTPAARPPLKSALRKGTARRRLQVVINESRNTYCEAAVEREEAGPAPLLVRALSLHLPEVLTCQTAGADAFDRIVAEGGEQLQETPVDDSEGSECSMETLEELAGPAPLARLDDDITLETPAEPPAKEPEVSSVTPSSGDTAEPVDPQPSEQSVSVSPQDGAAGEETQECTQKAANDVTNDNSESAESEVVCDLKERSPSPVEIRPGQQEPAANECSDARSPSPEACSAQPPRAPDWRNLPDLVSDGARAAAADQPPSPPAGSVLTIANVQQHDRVMEIADSRAHGVLGGILKGGRLWAGGRGAESDDSGDSQPRRGRGRSVRFEGRAPPEPAPRHLPPPPPPPAPESDGESSLSSLETVVARSGARPSPQLETELTGEQRALAQLTLGSPLGRTSADVARAIEQNSLRRSLVHAGEKRSARPTVAAPPSRWSTPEVVGWDRASPQTGAGARHSAASSADSKDSLGSQRSRDSRSSYSLDDIDDVLSEPTPAVPPAAGSGDSGYGSTDGRAGAETDELAAFAERESARTERLRRRYVSPGGEPGARQPAVRRVRSGSERTGWTPVADGFGQPAPRGTRPAVETMSHGYVYPEYVPARVPPLPPRQGQVRPSPAGWPPSVGQRADWGGGPPWAEQHGQWLPGRTHSGHLVHPGLGAGPRDDRLRRSAHY
ncbi:hypothetical protein FJT64_006606 [Amphibalanus amphitrite]|uniref:Uncharacterized protein n=1 Tax=Amphibalanus amphitrite TaxID=1232801 RepID=A0A6A4VWV1_AMPAM|nr:hypothetical protein FJT64_006606 [Amphibalanus amphitrite]